MLAREIAPIVDWDDAYANSAHIPRANDYIERWEADALAWRQAALARGGALLDRPYGSHPREQYDIFYPTTTSRGLVVFVHGGYWLRFDRRYWSHLAEGAVTKGYTVMMPSYRLCPDTTLAAITEQVARAMTHAYKTESPDGRLPLTLAGHSAGGQIVTRLLCTDSALPADLRQAITVVMSISGVHDLRPLLKTALNESLNLDLPAAVNASPALNTPDTQAHVYCVAGSDERPEFIRQTQLLPLVWFGLGINTSADFIDGKHHFNIIDALRDPDSSLITKLLRT